jgi:tetratricopeptide (TPR) repeat protein
MKRSSPLEMITVLTRLFISVILLVGFALPLVAEAKTSADGLLKQARKLVNEKKHKEAQAVFEKIIQGNPKNAEAYAGLAWSQFSQGQRDVAEENARKSLALDNKIPMAHNVMGAILFSKGMVEEAKNEFRTVLKIDPKRRCGGCADLRSLLGNDIPAAQNTKGIK